MKTKKPKVKNKHKLDLNTKKIIDDKVKQFDEKQARIKERF